MSTDVAPDPVVAEAQRRGLLAPAAPPEDPVVAEARKRGILAAPAEDPVVAEAKKRGIIGDAAAPAPDESVRDSLLGLDPASRSARFTANRAALDAKEKNVAQMGAEAFGGTLERAASDTYHGVVDPLKEGISQLQKDDAAREHPPLGDAPAGPNVGAPQRTVGDSALTAAKMVGKSAMGLGAAVTGIAPALSVAGQADAAAGTNVLPAWKRMTTEAADKIVPKSAPGSIVDNLVPDAARTAAVDATQFALENAPLAGALKLAHGGGVSEPAQEPAARTVETSTPVLPAVEAPSPPASVVPPEDFGKLAEVATAPSNEIEKQEIQPPETAPEKSPAAKPFRPRAMSDQSGAVRVPTGAEVKQFVAGPKSVTTQIGDVIDGAVAPYVEKAKEALAGTKVGRALEAVRSAIKDQPADLVGPGYVAAKENAAGEGRWQANQAAPHVEALTKAMKDATPEQQAAVTDWARKSKTTPDSPFPAGFTPEQEAATRAALDHFNVMRQKMVDVGAMSPHALGEYDRFLPTRYEEFQNQPYRPGGGSPKVNPLNAAHDGWGARVMLPESEAAKAVGEAEPDYLHAVKDAKGNPETLVKFSTPEGYQEWKDNLKTVFGDDADKLVKDEFTKFDPKANRLTRITDPARLLKIGYDEASARIAKHTFLNGLAKMTDEKGPYVKDARAVQRPKNQAVSAESGYTKLEGRGWGKLDGKLVRNDARADLVQSFGDKAELSQKQRMLQGMYDFAKGGMNAFKTARVVFHPAMVARHVAAAASELTYMGYDPFNPENAPRIASAAKDVAPGGKYYENVVRRGYEEAGGAVSREEILKSDAMKSPAERAGEALFSGGVSEGRSPLTNSTFATPENAAVVKEAYLRAKQGMSRAVFDPLVRAQKIGYALLRNEGLSDAAAAAEVEKFTMDPQKFSGGTKVLSDVLAPWLRYHLEAARVATNAAVEHPTRFAIDRLRTRIVQATIAAATGLALSDKEKQAIDDEHPGAVAIGRDKDGKPMLLDARYLDMLGGSPIYTGRTKVGEGMDTAAGIRKYLLDKTSIGENPVADVISAVTTGKDRNGRDTSGFQSWLRNFTPGLTPAVGWDARKIAAAAKGEQASQTTQKQTVLQSALDALGIKENSLDPKFEKDRIDNEEGQIVNRRNVRAAALKGETLDTESPDKEASAREEPLTIADIDAQLAAAQKRLDAAPGHVAPAITAHMDNLKKARLQLTGPKPYRPKNVPEPAGR